MTERVACLVNGKVVLVRAGHALEELDSPYAERVRPREPGTRVVGLARGRVSGELCYVIQSGSASSIFGQKPGTREEQRLFHDAHVQLRELDFSFAAEAFACTVDEAGGTSSIGVLADDGKGLRTVTEGDVLDRGPRWVPGTSGDIVYASAGVGRTKSGAWAGLSPFSLHRLRLADRTVEVLVSDAKYDYVSPVPVSDSLIYALRRPHQQAAPPASVLGALGDALLGPFRTRAVRDAARASAPETSHELVRITAQASTVVAENVSAFDIASNGEVVLSNGHTLSSMAPTKAGEKKLLAELARIEHLVLG